MFDIDIMQTLNNQYGL